MADAGRRVITTYGTVSGLLTEFAALVGAPVAVIAALRYGLPIHARVTFWVMLFATGLGINLGFHRLFAHRSFATFRPVEWVLMILGCMAGENAPFFWVATHRVHHRHSDRDRDPHSPRIRAGRRLPTLRGFWHAHFAWYHSPGVAYPESSVRDLARRPDLAWVDRHCFRWYLLGLAIPVLVGLLVGGTAYDALIAFLWAGLFRQFVVLQLTSSVNSLAHLWGTRPYDTLDGSRNNFLLGVLALGEGWHNNHHAFPSSARLGFHWWQPDLTWGVIWLMERAGLAWRVRRPDPARMREAVTRPVA